MSSDRMPDKVCQSCIVKLNHFDEFYESCVKAERFLRTFYTSDPQTDVASHSDSGKTLSCFIVNELTERDCIFTCRKCFRTFTKESSALRHICIRLEDCDELTAMDVSSDQAKLPPLKIRLFSMRSGLFMCYLCQAQFENKENVLSHIRVHFEEEKLREKENITLRRGKRGRNDEDDLLKSINKRGKKKRRKSKRTIKDLMTADNNNCLGSLTKSAANCPQSQNSQELEILQAKTDKTYGELQEAKPTADGVKYHDRGVETRQEEKNSYAKDEEYTGHKVEDVTVIEEVDRKSPTSFSSCIFCDKIFATNGALVAHQKKHLRGCLEVNFEDHDGNCLSSTTEAKLIGTSSYYSFLCNTCTMMFTSKKTLLEHEQYHLVDFEAIG